MRHARFVTVALLAVPVAAFADRPPDHLNEATIVELQQQMARGRLTSVELTRYYLQRIVELDQKGPNLNSFIELNPDAIGMAQIADAERRHGIVRGPLHRLQPPTKASSAAAAAITIHRARRLLMARGF